MGRYRRQGPAVSLFQSRVTGRTTWMLLSRPLQSCNTKASSPRMDLVGARNPRNFRPPRRRNPASGSKYHLSYLDTHGYFTFGKKHAGSKQRKRIFNRLRKTHSPYHRGESGGGSDEAGIRTTSSATRWALLQRAYAALDDCPPDIDLPPSGEAPDSGSSSSCTSGDSEF